jgi:hypothetical protein
MIRSLIHRHEGVVFFVAALVAVLALKWSTLHQPPVWDSTMGLFPAAITLSETGFDLWDLVHQPGSMAGGPNNHSLSVVTWLTAVIIRIFGESRHLFPTLHLVHFLLTALALTGLYLFARPVVGRGVAGLVSVTVLLFPVFLTQAGYMYFEIPLVVCTIFALLSWSRGQVGRTLLWVGLASLTKESGILVGIALAAAALLQAGPYARRFVRAGTLLAVPVFVLMIQIVFLLSVEEASGFERPTYGAYLLNDVWSFLRAVPDLLALVVFFLLIALVKSPERLRILTGDSPSDADHRRGLVDLIVYAFVGFYLLFPLTGVEMHVLPRYYVQIVPFLFLGLVDFGQTRFGRRATGIGLAIFAFVFVMNRKGELYYPPVPANEFAIAERSSEYLDLLSAQRQAIDALADLPDETAIIYGLPEHFLLSYPTMGYVDEKPSNGTCLMLEEPYSGGRLADYPDDFTMLYNYLWLGGLRMQALLKQARENPAWKVGFAYFEEGPFKTYHFRLVRKADTAP